MTGQHVAAVVTGGSSGIGRAISEALLERGVLVHDMSRSTTGIDVTDPAQVSEAYDSFGEPPGLLVACAGIIAPALFPEDASVQDWRRVLDVNLTGTFIVALEHVQRLVRADRPGRIMVMGSPSGRRPSLKNLAYGVSKAAVLALGLGLARGLEPHGIRTYVLCPSHVDTPMLRARGFTDIEELSLLDAHELAAEAARLLLDDNHLDGQPIYVSRMVTAKQQ